ncbi:putative 3'-5' exonuclease Ecym_5323 [Eremothecium cymbalariae DBVPG|uniref:RNA exonuclease 4 n=1 Tax=Eremothecium cymbalariae (strain CBS 270.75 / DBVPG 7215 / KCTC 17166 / NRRL Y-17582) TaxID=931890 RepID=I6NDE0_ERECY|nr:hypothetical protein Ecym_5323 [Eremothecium cymbalariae DBVPG\
MRLSSNWLKLQKANSIPVRTGSHRSEGDTVHKVRVDVRAREKTKKSRAMSYVAKMNKEIMKSKSASHSSTDGTDSKLEEIIEEDIKSQAGKRNDRTKEIGKYVAMDCEFVGVGPEGKTSALARVSIVNYYGNEVLDVYVRPSERITDYRTWVSGIMPHHMKHAIPFKQAQDKVSTILKDRILIGHSIYNDLKVLMISHPRRAIRDTAEHAAFQSKYNSGHKPSLKKLATDVLGLNIQNGSHSSLEDARTALLLFKHDQQGFERRYWKQNRTLD